MRQTVLQAMLAAALLLMSCGCQAWNRWRHPNPYAEKAPPTFAEDFTKERLVEHINQNIERTGACPAWRCDRASVKMTGVPAKLSATLAVRAPHSLRLRVALPLGAGDVLDLGSNDEHFWMWMKDGQATPVMTVRHDEFDQVARAAPMPIPVHPDWLMEVLGVIPLDPEEYELVRPGGNQPYVDLVATRVSPDGERVQRIVRVNPRHGLIVEHRLQKLNGELLAKAALAEHYQDPASKAVVPRVIIVDLVAEGRPMSLTLTLDGMDVNSASLATEDYLWAIPDIPGSERVDMAQWLRSQGRLRAPVAELPPVRPTKFSKGPPQSEKPGPQAENEAAAGGSRTVVESEEPIGKRDQENPWARRSRPAEDDEAERTAEAAPLETISRKPRPAGAL